MAGYVLRRLVWSIAVLWVVITFTFGAAFLSPVDPARSYAGLYASNETVERVREEFGLNRPIWVQYALYLRRAVRGDFGKSYTTDQAVTERVLSRLPATMLLAGAAMAIGLTLGIPLGLAAALGRGTILDRGILAFSLVGIVTPTFVLGLILLYVFGFRLGWFPLGGSGSAATLVLPALTLGLASAAWYARVLRSTVLNIMGEDYVRLARAKGLPERVVIGRHVLRNSLGPVIAMVGLDIATLLGGVLVVEQVFGWPGIGQQGWSAINRNDIPLVMATVLTASVFVVLANLVADIANAVIDPRVVLR